MSYPRHDVDVELLGHDGNAFYILGAVDRELRRAGVSQEERDSYREEATSGDYDHLLAVTEQWVNIV